MEIEKENRELAEVIKQIYEKCALQISNLKIEEESKEYSACQFKLNRLDIIFRSAKITPKKNGQFVTFWKRNEEGPIEPFLETDPIDFYVVNVRNENNFGQFVFPRFILIKKGIISTARREGKRAFRVYAPWDDVKSKQAEQTQKWQLDYFFEVLPFTDFKGAKALYDAQSPV